MRRNLQLASHSIWQVVEVHTAAKLIGNLLMHDAVAVTRLGRRYDKWTPALLPPNAKPPLRVPVSREAPAHYDDPGACGNRPVFCCVGSELVENHSKYLAGFRVQDNIRSIKASIARSGIGRQLATHKFRKRDPLPLPGAQQLMRDCH